MSEGSGQPLRFCTSCGAKARAGTSFCVSCGASLVQNPEAPTSAHDAVASGGEPKAEDGSLQDHRAPQDQDGESPQSIYDRYALHRRFFQEARDGLVGFSERLKRSEDDAVNNEHLTHNDLAGPLLYAQMGLDKVEEYKETLTAPILGSKFSLQEARSMLTELRKIQGEVLTSLETFWEKLEAEEGHAQFKDEFAGWYTESLEPHASAEPNHVQRRSAPDLLEPPLRGQRGPTESSQGQYEKSGEKRTEKSKGRKGFTEPSGRQIGVGIIVLLILIVIIVGQDSDSSGPYGPSGTVEDRIRSDIQRQSNNGEDGYFKYIIIESESEHEDRYDLRSEILDEYGYYCRAGGKYYNDKFSGNVYDYFYNCFQKSIAN